MTVIFFSDWKKYTRSTVVSTQFHRIVNAPRNQKSASSMYRLVKWTVSCRLLIYTIQYLAQFGLIIRIEYIKTHEQAVFLTIH